MLFFVNATPYVMTATVIIFALLSLKYIELRVSIDKYEYFFDCINVIMIFCWECV